MKTYVSRRSYWILVGVFFTLVALVSCIIVFYGHLEYNLGVSLSTNSIFTVLTIVFFYLIFESREQNEWRTVQNEVYSMIQTELGCMFRDILNYVDGGLIMEIYLGNLKKEETRKEAFLYALSELKDAKELKLNDIEWKLVMEGKVPTAFSNALKALNEVEIKYSRFLSSQQTLSLIKIQNCIRTFDILRQLHTSVKGLNPLLGQVLLPAYQEVEKGFPRILSQYFKMILEEIYNLHNTGIKFSPYPTKEA